MSINALGLNIVASVHGHLSERIGFIFTFNYIAVEVLGYGFQIWIAKTK